MVRIWFEVGEVGEREVFRGGGGDGEMRIWVMSWVSSSESRRRDWIREARKGILIFWGSVGGGMSKVLMNFC
jgi:hypothetical protein